MNREIADHMMRPSLWLASWSLLLRDAVRFLRQRSRIAGALGTPLIFWLLIGMGLGNSFAPAGVGTSVHYLEYFFPGTLVMILLFSAIFSTYSVIEDRKEGFLQAVLVSPAPRSSIVLGKLLGGAIPAWLQGMLFCLLAPLSGLHLTPLAALELSAIVFLIAIALTGLGFVAAWPMDSGQGFHAIMNLVLFPLWLLSGSLFPPSGAPLWLQWVMKVNPVTYAVAAVRCMFYPDAAATTGGGPGLGLSLAGVGLFAVVTFACSLLLVKRTPAGSRKRLD